MGKIQDRIKKLIEDDRPLKVKSFLFKHQIHVDDFSLRKGETMLHYSAKKCSSGVLVFLINAGVDSSQLNDKGQTALEIAIGKALKSRRSTGVRIYQEIIMPLVDYQPPNVPVIKLNVKVKQQLNKLQDKLFNATVDSNIHQNCTGQSSKLQESEPEIDSDNDASRRWNDKLADEYEDEYMSSWGHYEEDFCEETEKESFDQWASRIDHEYKSRQTVNRHHPYTKATKPATENTDKFKKSSEQKLKEEKLRDRRKQLEKIYEEKQKKMKEMSKLEDKYKYEEKFSKLLKTKGERKLKFCDIPWPFTSKLSTLTNFLFCDLPNKSSDAYRKYVRDQQVRWHPDKFQQNFGEFLEDNERDKILELVTEISQVLNKLSEKG